MQNGKPWELRSRETAEGAEEAEKAGGKTQDWLPTLLSAAGEPGIGDDEQEVKADDVVEPGSETSEDGSR